MSAVNFPSLISKVATLDVQRVQAFRASAKLTYARERLELEKARQPEQLDPILEDLLADRHDIAHEIFSLSEELAVVASYRVLELNIAPLYRRLDKGLSSFSWDGLKRSLKAKLSIQLIDLQSASEVDELRLLNNAIKHNGRVTSRLVRYGWKAGEKLYPLAPALDRLAPHVPVFVGALARTILPASLGGDA